MFLFETFLFASFNNFRLMFHSETPASLAAERMPEKMPETGETGPESG